jgi:hypothetical protein
MMGAAMSDMPQAQSGPNASGPPPIVTRARALIGRLVEGGVNARLLGGVAIALRCPTALPPSALARNYSDLDIVVNRAGRRHLSSVLDSLDFTGATRFNAMNGHARQLYTSNDGVDLDVFIDEFKMCHHMDLKDRLLVDSMTLPLADLMLTKLQVAELTEKDVRDCTALVLDHALTDDDSGISVTRICAITGGDWGWWRTVTENLGKVRDHADRLGLTSDAAAAVSSRTGALEARIDEAPKTLRWRARARLGDRMPWRDEPGEKRRA